MLYHFSATRLTSGNLVFADKISINSNSKILTIYKGRLIGYNEKTIKCTQIIGVNIMHRKELLLFSEIEILTAFHETIKISGFTSSDTKQIKQLLESLM